jgi:ATP-binding cassette subfamily B protein
VRHVRKPIIDPKDLPSVELATLKRIFLYIAPYRWRAASVLACMGAAATLNLTAPWFLKQIVDQAIPAGNVVLLWLYSGGMVAGPLTASLFQIVQKYNAEGLGQQVMLDLRVRVYQQLHEMPFDFFTKQKPGEAVSTCSTTSRALAAASGARWWIWRRTRSSWP